MTTFHSSPLLFDHVVSVEKKVNGGAQQATLNICFCYVLLLSFLHVCSTLTRLLSLVIIKDGIQLSTRLIRSKSEQLVMFCSVVQRETLLLSVRRISTLVDTYIKVSLICCSPFPTLPQSPRHTYLQFSQR